jgi:hypothetical protein
MYCIGTLKRTFEKNDTFFLHKISSKGHNELNWQSTNAGKNAKKGEVQNEIKCIRGIVIV